MKTRIQAATVDSDPSEKEKLGVEKEIQELRKRLDKVDEWKRRREEIDKELNKVWAEEGELAPPPYELGNEEAVAEVSNEATEEANVDKTQE